MTLVEAIVALTLLGVSAVAYLQRFHADADAVQRARAWHTIVAAAEAAMETSKAMGPRGERAADGIAQVRREPWRGRLDDVQVDVRLPDGTRFTLHRLERRP